MPFKEELKSIIEKVNEQLNVNLPIEDIAQKNIIEAMKYSVNAGGKRLRPVLSVAVSRLLGGKDEDILPFGIAIEMIHTYSLIHDDLPCMDDDDLRRGKPTNHKVFGEAMAVLAGDGLLNRAFEVLISAAIKSNDKANALKAMDYIAKASSYHGMIGGQVMDMENENKSISVEVLKNMHSLKTGALICAAVMAPTLLYDIGEKERNALESYARNLGLAFQVKDDILDVEGTEEVLGKKIGSDNINGKTTYITLYGLTSSKAILDKLTNDAISALNVFGEKADFLKQLAIYLLKREN